MTQDTTNINSDQLHQIAAAVMQAAEADTLEEVLQRIAHTARDLIGARYAALGVPDGAGGLRYFKVSGISEADIAKIEHPPEGRGLLGAIMNNRETLRLEHMTDDSRSVGFPKGHPSMDAMLGVSIKAGGELFGMFYLTDRVDGLPFTMQDQWLLEALAGYAALAIAGKELRESEQRLSILEERSRIGMELHDGVIQSLYAVGMQLDLIKRGVMGIDDIDGAIVGLNGVIEDIRDYIMDLKTSTENTLTVREHLDHVLMRLYIPDDLKISVDAPEKAPRLPTVLFDSICMVAREAISNVVRHAQAEHLTIRCEQNMSAFLLIIRDDGVGFDLEKLENRQSLGLQNMRARVDKLRGTLEIQSERGHGTALIIHIPMP